MAVAASKLPEIHPVTRPHVPHELVSEILARLPVGVLQRVKCVCKAWRDTISDDPSFLRAHLRHQRRKDPWLLIAPEIETNAYSQRGRYSRYAGWYQWEEDQSDLASLVYSPDSSWLFSTREVLHKFAHCDGLVLVPTDTTVHVFNPATRRVLELPRSPRCAASAWPPMHSYRHQTFGLGHDPRSNTYKVVRLFRFFDILATNSNYNNNLCMEVFTIGTDRYWRETAAQPPYSVTVGMTATYCKGSLFWIPMDDDAALQVFVCFSLEDESFSLVRTPGRIDRKCCLAARGAVHDSYRTRLCGWCQFATMV